MILTSSCALRPVVDDACTSFQPIYLTEDEIKAIKPFRDLRVQIGSHNRKWEERCGERG